MVLAIQNATASGILGMDDPVTPASIPGGGNPAGGNARASALNLGKSCRSKDPNHICIALNWVSFKDASGKPTVSQADAVSNVETVNQVLSQCNVGFQIEGYQELDSAQKGLNFNISNVSDLDSIRNEYATDKALLVVVTGAWNRAGSLGSTPANAWTSMPGSGPYGAVLEQPVGNYPNIIAHELGHYLNLDHIDDTSNLMNPVIYTGSKSLDSSQCNTARSAANYFWTSMLR